MNSVRLRSTPRPRQGRFRRLSSFGRRSGPQGQFSIDDTTLQERIRTREVLRSRCVVRPPLGSPPPPSFLARSSEREAYRSRRRSPLLLSQERVMTTAELIAKL